MLFLKNNFILILILILALILRVNPDTFISGLNFDEFAIVSLAKTNFLNMLKAIAIEDYHAPLYYFIVHFLNGFENQFLILRLLNILFSLLNVFVFYKIGKLLYNKQFGYLLALLLCVNHLQVSIANFIKFYALAFFLVSLSFYYLLAILKEKKDVFAFGIVNFLLILVHTFGFVFVIFEFLILLFNKCNVKKSLICSCVAFMFFAPFLLMQTKNAFLNSLISVHSDYPSLSFYGIYIFLNDYFSPLINYSCNVETIESSNLLLKVFNDLYNGNTFDFLSFFTFLFLSLIPVLIGIFGLFLSFKNKIIKNALILSFLYFSFFVVLVFFEATGFIPLYIFSSGIIFLICALFGLNSLNKTCKCFLIGYLLIAQLVIPYFYPIDKRETPYKRYANIDEHIANIGVKTPMIIINAGRFAKYYYKDKNVFSLDYEELRGAHSKKWLKLIFGDYVLKNLHKKNIKDVLLKAFLENKENNALRSYLKDEIISKIQTGDKLVVAFNPDGNNFLLSDEQIKESLSKEFEFSLIPSGLYDLAQKNENNNIIRQHEVGSVILSIATKKIINELERDLRMVEIEQFAPVPMKKYIKISQETLQGASLLNLTEKPLLGWVFVTYQKQ